MTRVRLLRLMISALVGVLWITPLRAQQTTGTVRGRVVDSTAQQPLSGVTVSLGSHRSVTGADGRYLLIGVAAGTDSVRARIIGYAPGAQAVTVAGGDTVTVDFMLIGQAVNLSEVVVVGYGEQHAGEITSSVTQVSAKDFNQGPTVSPQMLIENKVAGVQVVDNNQPGGGLSIRIRGSSSVNASSEPLYVVDGVVLGAGGGISAGNDPLNFLNPDDIESITVLKDAAAAAIYGTNASNGVVLITTKSGLGRPRVEYSGSFSSSSVTRLPSMLSAAQFRAAVLADTTVTLHLKTDTLLGAANTNWFSLIDRTATGQQHNVALTGAGASNSYRLSLGYQNQQGILQGTNVEKISLGVNYNQRLFSDRLDLRANIRGSLENDQFTPSGVLSNAAQMGPTQPVFDPASVFGYYNWPGYSLQSANNPVEILNLSADQGTSYRSVGNLQAKYDFSSFEPLQGLTGTVNLAYDVTQTNRASFFPDSIAPEIKSGKVGQLLRQPGHPGEHAARHVPRLCAELDLRTRHHRPDGRLLVLAVPWELHGAGHPEHHQRQNRHQRHRTGQDDARQPREHPRLQVDLVLRAGQLQHQRPLSGVGQHPARRFLALWSRQPVGQFPGGVPRLADLAGAVHE